VRCEIAIDSAVDVQGLEGKERIRRMSTRRNAVRGLLQSGVKDDDRPKSGQLSYASSNLACDDIQKQIFFYIV
jgi:hypothetical protein